MISLRILEQLALFRLLHSVMMEFYGLRTNCVAEFLNQIVVENGSDINSSGGVDSDSMKRRCE